VGERGTSGLWTPAQEVAVAVAVLAHGAGNAITHPYFVGIAAALAREGVATLRFNFPYADRGRGRPDPAPVLLATWRAALGEGASRGQGLPLVAAGKSLGGRVASMVAAEDGDGFAGDALVFFGYPLHAPGAQDRPRDAHLGAVTAPMLFVQGTRDPFARFDLISSLVDRLAPLAELHAVEGGDHSHRVRGVERPDEEIGEDLGRVAAAFVRRRVLA
jgi:predicted alpha/beta-hydrolase family hydrolase